MKMSLGFRLIFFCLACAALLSAEETAPIKVANPAATKIVLDPAAQEDAQTILDSAQTSPAAENQAELKKLGVPPQGALENGTNEVSAVKIKETAPVKAGEKAAESEAPRPAAQAARTEKGGRANAAMDIAVWQKIYLESETQCVWQAETDSVVEDLLTSVQAPATVTFGPKDLLRIDYGGELAYRADYSNGILTVSFTGSPLRDKRLLLPFEYPWDDLLGIPIQGSLTNYYLGAFQEGELWRYDFVLLPEAQMRFRKKIDQYSHVALRRHVWFDKVRQRIVKTYRRALDGAETTFIFKVEE